ncbi:MAG: carboxyl-terminal protease [Clostridia bacterium]|nr:carboxyl-terminal protease [Clostridia bacterium]
MNKKISVGAAIVVVALSVLITFQLTYIGVNNKYEKVLSELKDTQLLYDKLASVDALYRSSYIGDIDETALVDSVLKGYVDGTGDKYGAYYNKDEFAQIVKDSNAELVGIGINVIYDYEYSAIRIINVMPDSPALEAGAMPGDLIAYVSGQPMTELGYSSALSMLRGEEKTFAEMTVLRDGKLIDFKIERRKITDYTVYSHVHPDNADIGIVQILEFDDSTPLQLKAALRELEAKGVSKLVFDVRNNPGGYLDSIKDVLDYLLPEGAIIRIQDAAGKEEVLTSDASQVDMPMMVLVNGNTASAAELFASVLRDYGKAKLVGETTYGKGTTQTMMPLYDGSAVSVSQNLCLPPISESYEGVGLEPDIKIELPDDITNKSVFLLGDSEDLVLIAAVNELTKENN